MMVNAYEAAAIFHAGGAMNSGPIGSVTLSFTIRAASKSSMMTTHAENLILGALSEIR